jgi:hypothetical protein
MNILWRPLFADYGLGSERRPLWRNRGDRLDKAADNLWIAVFLTGLRAAPPASAIRSVKCVEKPLNSIDINGL